MVDEINYTDEELSVICEKIYNTSKAIFNASSNVSVCVYGLNGKNKQTGCDFYGRTDTINGLESILKKVSHTELTADDLVNISRATSISEAIDYVALSYIISNIDDDQFEDNFNGKMSFSEAVKNASELGIAFDHEEFGFIFFDADRTNCNINGFETLFSIGSNSYNIKQSIVSNVPGIENEDEYKYSYARVLFDETEGMNFDIAANREVFVEDVIKYIYGKVPTKAGAYDAIIATGYSTVVLDKPLTEHDMELAEKLYDDPEYAFSEEEVKDCADTDRDGLYDFEEVMFYTKKLGKHQLITYENNEIKLPSVNTVVNALNELAYVQSGREKTIEQYGDSYDEFLCLSVLPIKSDPTSVDGDGDGIDDIDDLAKLRSMFTGILMDSAFGTQKPKVGFKVDYNMFFNDETKFNKDLSVFASLLSQDVYENSYIRVDGMPYNGDSSLNMPSLFGLYDIKDIVIRNPKAVESVESETGDNIDVDDDDITEFIIGHRKVVSDSESREVIVIIVRGTNGTIEEWASNFDVGADTDDYYNAVGQCDLWTNTENHKGFDVTANRVLAEIDAYMNNEFIDKSVGYSYYVTGHSRGAAIANLIAKGLIDNQKNNDKVFGYTFAAPNTTTSKEAKLSKYNSIFNIVNTDDLIPYLPLGEPCGLNSVEYNSWGFTKYGIIKTFSIKDNCESKWESISHKWDYNSNGNFNDTLFEFGNIIDTSGVLSRNYLYKFTDSDDACISFNILNYIDDQTAKNEFEKMYGERMSRYCKISIVDKSPSIFDPTEHKAIIQQSPAFLMMDLVYITVKEEMGGRIHGVLGCDVAPKYEKAKWEFIHSGIDSMVNIGLGGMRDPHLPISYYCISTELK